LNAHPGAALTCLCFFAGATPLLCAAVAGHTEAIAVLLAADASVSAVDLDGHSCLTYAAAAGHTAAVRQLLQAWQAPPTVVLRSAVQSAAEHNQLDAVVPLLRQLGKQDMAAAAEVMQAMPDAVPALLDAVLGSEARQLAEQRRGLQVLVLGLTGTRKRAAAAGLSAGRRMASSDECSEGECTAGAADGVSAGAVLGQKLMEMSTAAAEADDAGCASVAGSHGLPGNNVGHVSKRKRGRKASLTSESG
jgi:hypothetical protein